jgi:uncharacterized protein (UPF0332 family)
MMRSSELQYCLNSPYLWFDETSNTLVTKDLEKAEQLLKESKEKKDIIDQLNTAYQSMYCAAQALLHSINYKASGFRCVITVLEEFFVKRGSLDRIHVDALVRAQKLEGTPQESIDAAEKFLGAAKQVLKK